MAAAARQTEVSPNQLTPPTTPGAPRAIPATGGTENPGEVEAKDLHMKLLLLSLLSPSKKEAEKRGLDDVDEIHEMSTSDEKALRRRFLDKLAYLCDAEKHGDTVTATALQQQQLDGRPVLVLHLAMNREPSTIGLKQRVKDFVGYILHVIPQVTAVNRDQTEAELLRKAVVLASQRIEYYKGKMITQANQCLRSCAAEPYLRQQAQWLEPLIRQFLGISNDVHLVQKCYAARGRDTGTLQLVADLGFPCFSQLAHYVGRLGAHLSAVRIVLLAAMKIPALRTIQSRAGFEQAPEREAISFPQGISAYQAIWDICTDQASQNGSALDREERIVKCLTAFAAADVANKISAQLRTAKPISTTLHCEIQLADMFSRRRWVFFGGDGYIGCSKPACYFCKEYLEQHPKRFEVGSSHGKVLPNVRIPKPNQALDKDGHGARLLGNIERRMVASLDKKIFQTLSEPSSRVGIEHCSTNGSSRATSVAAVAGRRP